MKILFIGAVEFSAHMLHELIVTKANIVGVCTLAESTFNSDHVNLAPLSKSAGIPVRYSPDINDLESVAWIRCCAPDIIFCFGWSRLIREPILRIPRLGVIGFHPAALPENRGRHPLIWALALGLTETASTFFFMDEGPDSGDILSQVKVSIAPTDDARTLYSRIKVLATRQMKKFLPLLANGNYVRKPQDHRLANNWRKRGEADGRIDWRMSAVAINNLVRALTKPYVGAHFNHHEGAIKVWKTQVEEAAYISVNLEPGKVLAIEGDSVLVKAGLGAIWLTDFGPKVNIQQGSYL